MAERVNSAVGGAGLWSSRMDDHRATDTMAAAVAATQSEAAEAPNDTAIIMSSHAFHHCRLSTTGFDLSISLPFRSAAR